MPCSEVPVKLRSAALTFAVSSGFALAACGSDEKSSSEGSEEVTPAVAVSEIAKVKAGLDQAVAQVKSGDSAAAEETVANTYVDHFELVEGPLEKVDHELNEELEEGIRTELAEEIKSGASAAVVSKHVDELKHELDTAAEKLR
jgi:hypothetical protein